MPQLIDIDSLPYRDALEVCIDALTFQEHLTCEDWRVLKALAEEWEGDFNNV